MAFDMRRAAGEKGADFGRQRRIGHPPNWPTPGLAHWRVGRRDWRACEAAHHGDHGHELMVQRHSAVLHSRSSWKLY